MPSLLELWRVSLVAVTFLALIALDVVLLYCGVRVLRWLGRHWRDVLVWALFVVGFVLGLLSYLVRRVFQAIAAALRPPVRRRTRAGGPGATFGPVEESPVAFPPRGPASGAGGASSGGATFTAPGSTAAGGIMAQMADGTRHFGQVTPGGGVRWHGSVRRG